MSYLSPESVQKGLRESFKQAVRAASTANLSLAGTHTAIDGVTLADEDRVLLKNQSTASENGLYIWSSGTQMFTRSRDGLEFESGCLVAVQEGSTHADQQWQLDTNNPIVVGSTAQTWSQTSGGGGGGESLAATLAIGNTSGGTSIILSSGDSLLSEAGANLDLTATVPGGSGGGVDVNITASNANTSGSGGSINLTAGDGVGTDQDGGVLVLAAGSPTGVGAEGYTEVTNGDLRVTEALSLAESTPGSAQVGRGQVLVGDGTGGSATNGLHYLNAAGSLTRLDNPSSVVRTEYIEAGFTGNKAIADASIVDQLIDLDEVVESNVISLSGNIFSLRAGKTYKLEAYLGVSDISGAEILQVQWYDRTASVLIGRKSVTRSLDTTTTIANSHIASTIFTPSVDTDVDLRTIAGGSGAVTIVSTRSWVRITQIGGITPEGSGEFMFATSSTSQAALAANDQIEFDTVGGNQGITLSSFEFSLKSGKKYWLFADARIESAPDGDLLVLQFYDETNAAFFGGISAHRPVIGSDQFSSRDQVVAFIQPTTDIDVSLRVLSQIGNPTLSSLATCTIFEIGAVSSLSNDVLDAKGTTGVNQGSLSVGTRIEFPTQLFVRGGISLDTTTNIGRVSLPSGGIFRCIAKLKHGSASSNSSLTFNWYDVTNAVDHPNSTNGFTLGPGSSSGSGEIPVTTTIVDTTSGAIDIEVRVLALFSTPSITGSSLYMTVERIG